MPIHQRSPWNALRNRARELWRELALGGTDPQHRTTMDDVLGVRGELAGPQAELLRALDVGTAAQLLQDPERIAAYAETLAAESALLAAAGEVERAAAARRKALGFALEAQRRQRAADEDLDELIARLQAAAGPA